MELQTFEKKHGNSLIARVESSVLLRNYARRVIRATEKSDGAKVELLFSLPGVFAVEFRFLSADVRLVKEGDVFRFAERHEKTREPLLVTVSDRSALKDLIAGRLSLNRCVAERRLTFSGRTSFFSALTRVLSEGDKALLSEKRYRESYLSEK